MNHKAITLIVTIIIINVFCFCDYHVMSSNIAIPHEFAKPKIVFYAKDLSIPIENFSVLRQMLESKGFNVSIINEITSYEVFENAQLFILIACENVTKLMTNLTKFFIGQGGSVLLAPFHEKTHEYDDILRIFGMEFTTKIVRDNESNYQNDTAIIHLHSPNVFAHTSHPITLGISNLIVPYSVAIKFTGNVSLEMIFHNYTLLWGQNTTYIDLNNNNKPDANEPKGKNVTLAVAIEAWSGAKVVITGSAKIFSDEFINVTQNYIIVERIVDWLSGRKWSVHISNLKVSQQVINYDETKTINVSFDVSDTAGNPVMNASIWIVLQRAGRLVRNVSVNVTGQIHYELTLNLTGLTRGEFLVRVLVYKEFWGFFWSASVRISIVRQILKPILDPIAISLWLVTLATGIVFWIRCSSWIKKQKRLVKELTEKLEKRKT